MKKWTKILMLAVVATFAVAIVSPKRASAVDSADILIWSAVGVGAAIAIVLVATYFARDDSQLFLVEPPQDANDASDSPVHFGTQCRNPDGTVALLCW